VESIGDAQRLVLRLKNVGFTIDETNDAMLAVIKAIMTENKTFNGGVSFGTVSMGARATRERLNIGGDVKIGYILYGGNAITISM